MSTTELKTLQLTADVYEQGADQPTEHLAFELFDDLRSDDEGQIFVATDSKGRRLFVTVNR